MTRILIVEDEESYREPLVYQLTREGYDVSAAATGEEGLELFTKGGIDLVLLDLMLPGLDGTALCRRIREQSRVPIIMLTAKSAEIDKVVGLEIGADDYITNRTRSASCWRGCVRCCDATRWWPTRRNPPMTIFR